MPRRILTDDDERLVREVYRENTRIQRELLDVEDQIMCLMQRRADIRAELRKSDTIALAEKFGCSHQVILTALRPRPNHALA